MDTLSLAVGFIVGAATGAAGNYFGSKYTDQRREKKAARDEDRLWASIEARFPALIAEMREDFSIPEHRGTRAFFIRPSTSMIAFRSEPSFDYFTDKHPDLMAAIRHLQEHGYVQDITPGNTPMYRATERLVDRLRMPNSSLKRTDQSLRD